MRLPRLYFHSAHGFATRALAHTLDSLVRVSRRVNWAHFVRVFQRIFPRSGAQRGGLVCAGGSSQAGRLPPPNPRCPARPTDPDTRASVVPPRTGRQTNYLWHWAQSLPFQQFQALLTLFSKFFSSFPHGTCSLSVSCAYLALDGIYHPLSAALPSNTTRRQVAGAVGDPQHGVITLSDRSFERQFVGASRGYEPVDYNPGCPGFKFELLPLHSPLLGES